MTIEEKRRERMNIARTRMQGCDYIALRFT